MEAQVKNYRVAFFTMGCRTNQYDSSRLAAEFEAAGFRLVPFNAAADVYVVNTCTVTAEADREARNACRRARARNPEAIVVATGCYPDVDPAPLQAIPGISLLGGNALKADLVERVRGMLSSESIPQTAAPVPHSPKGSGIHRTRQVIKVEEGCNYHCAYCVVPYARGKARSRPLPEIVEEVRRYAEAGTREIVLTGTCIGTYGKDLSPRISLAECAAALAAIPGIARLRISSIEPWEVEEEMIALIAENPVFCRHFHLPLQSGDDAVRRRMHRPGNSEQFAALVARIRERIPEAGITTDVIVGFPGESDAEFEASYDFCRRMQFSRMHVFRYSPRPFTPAAQREDQTPPPVKEARSQALIHLGEEMAGAFARQLLGKTVTVLAEGCRGKDGLVEGLTDTFIRVRFPGDPACRGELVPVRITDLQGDHLLGECKRNE